MGNLLEKTKGKGESLFATGNVKAESPFMGASPVSRARSSSEGDSQGIAPRGGAF